MDYSTMDLKTIKDLLQPTTQKKLWIDWLQGKLMIKENLNEIYDINDEYDPHKVIAALKETE